MSLDTLFSRYGCPSTEANINIHGYLLRADQLDEAKRIKSMDESAAHLVKELEALTADIREYRNTLVRRYGELETMPYRLRLELERRRQYKGNVFYYLRLVKVYEDGSKVVELSETYTGSERHNAIKRYEELLKQRPGINAVKDIEKKPWEKQNT